MTSSNEPGSSRPSNDLGLEDALDRSYHAVRAGDVAGLARAIEEYPGIAGDSDWSLALLDRAVEQGHAGIVSLLLRSGIPANQVGDFGVTPLMRAAWNGRTEVLRLLLRAGADPDILPETYDPEILPEDYGQSALFCALDRGHKDAVRVLHRATRPEIRRLARKAMARAQRSEAEDEDDLGLPQRSRAEMALLMAFLYKQPQDIGPAVAAGADINGRIFQEKSLLWTAAYHGNRLLTRLLLDHGADPNAPGDDKGQTALSIAVRMGQAGVIEELVAAGADPARADASGHTSWDYAQRPLCQDGGEALHRAWRETHPCEEECTSLFRHPAAHVIKRRGSCPAGLTR